MDKTYKIGNVAKMLDISTPALRKWSIQYAEHLSPDANPGPGKARRFTENDVSLLQQIANLRSTDDLSHDDILLRLDMESASLPDEAEDIALESVQDAQDEPHTALTPSLDMESIAPLLAAISANQIKSEQIHALTDDVKRIDKASEQTRMILIAVLVAMILVLLTVIVLILVLR